MNAQALRAPRVFVGTVDGSRDRDTPTPRTLQQAFGPAADYGHLVPMDADAPMPLADKVVLRASALAGLFVIARLIYERIAS
ncbi:hypothetical protein [uncultured Variovorax sp.]|uniref:hypothetical protein n=1 Tax=uncultured Variovorax sp. TaxID=114708 RepID=UPI0025FC04B0|nr:hypothetical protein [uncultured Variovorax sp.]